LGGKVIGCKGGGKSLKMNRRGLVHRVASTVKGGGSREGKRGEGKKSMDEDGWALRGGGCWGVGEGVTAVRLRNLHRG